MKPLSLITDEPTFEFIIPTYNRPNNLLCVISSITSQTVPNWKVHVVSDCSPEGSLDKIINFYKEDDRIKFTFLPKRYNDWGHTPRNYGLENSTEEWVIMTGDDNYYVPTFLEHFSKAVDPNTNFIYCNMIHSHFAYSELIDSKPWTGRIDIGNFASRSKFSKELRLDTGAFCADGKFVEEFTQRFCPNGQFMKKIDYALYVHN